MTCLPIVASLTIKLMTTWIASDMAGAVSLGHIEFRDKTGAWHFFDVMQTSSRLVFGGYTNTCFLESGYILREDETPDTTLAEMVGDLETYYNGGSQYVSRIVCNARM